LALSEQRIHYRRARGRWRTESRNNDLTIRDARDEDRQATQDVTLTAYQGNAAVFPAPFWTSYQKHLRAALAEEGPADRIVAERHCEILAGCFSLC
jgi:hypothetical protein